MTRTIVAGFIAFGVAFAILVGASGALTAPAAAHGSVDAPAVTVAS